MKKIILTTLAFLIMAFNVHAGLGEWTKSSWQKVNGVTDIPGPVSVDGDLSTTGAFSVTGNTTIYSGVDTVGDSSEIRLGADTGGSASGDFSDYFVYVRHEYDTDNQFVNAARGGYFWIKLTDPSNASSAIGIAAQANETGGANSVGRGVSLTGGNFQIKLKGRANINAAKTIVADVLFGSSNTDEASTVTDAIGLDLKISEEGGSARTYNVTNMHDIKLDTGTAVGSTINATTWNRIHVTNPADFAGTQPTLSGLWIDKQTRGDTNNYGIALDGDGAGSDIVMGPTQENTMSRDSTTGATLFTGTQGLGFPEFAHASKPTTCRAGTVIIVTDSDDCAADSGNGALCVCDNGGSAYTVLLLNY